MTCDQVYFYYVSKTGDRNRVPVVHDILLENYESNLHGIMVYNTIFICIYFETNKQN